MMSVILSPDSRFAHGFVRPGSCRCLSKFVNVELDDFMRTVDVENAGLSTDTLYSLLEQCTKKKDVAAARKLQMQMRKSGLNASSYWGNQLIRLFASCGSLPDVNQAFSEVSNPTIFPWNAIIAGHAQLGEGKRALDLHNTMQQHGIEPDKNTFLNTLKACGSIGDIERGRMLHRQVVRSALQQDVAVGSSLINMYSKCNSIKEAQEVFDEMSDQNVVTWTSLIAAYSMAGLHLSALNIFGRMQQERIEPTSVTFLCILKACANIEALEQGRLIHSLIIRSGLENNVNVGNTLVDVYGKSGSLREAHKVFDRLPSQNVISWSALIGGYAQHGDESSAFELFGKMLKEGIRPNRVTYLCIMKACGGVEALIHGRFIHDHMFRSAVEVDAVVGSTLVNMYAKCGSLKEAHKVFDIMPNQTVVSWDALIAGYSEHGQLLLAIDLLDEMLLGLVRPTEATFLPILKACSDMTAMIHGRVIHDRIITSELMSDVILGNALVDMYAKCGSLAEAYTVFRKFTNRNVVSWSALIAGCIECGHEMSALKFFEEMQQEGIIPDKATFTSILKACGTIGDTKLGELLHHGVISREFELDVIVGSAVIDMYAKTGCLAEAYGVFNALPCKNIVSWGSLISGFVQHGYTQAALQLYEKMQHERVVLDKATSLCTLKACSILGAIKVGASIHSQLTRSGFELDAIVGSALVDMYAKCACLEEAHKVFDGLSNQDLVTWGALIAGYARSGHVKKANELLKQMEMQGLRPGDAIYTSIISGCSYAGLLTDGQHLFRSMTEDHGIIPAVEQYGCMVDLFGRTGHLDDAKAVLQTMPGSPDPISWASLLTGCQTYGSPKIGKQCLEEINQLDSDSNLEHVPVLMTGANDQVQVDFSIPEDLSQSLYNEKRPDDARFETSQELQDSSIGTCDKVEIGTCNKASKVEIGTKLDWVWEPSKRKVQLNAVIEKPMKDKTKALCNHCEKLALALGLRNSYKTCITKESYRENIDLCSDCHNSIKTLSKVGSRQTSL